MDQTSIFGAPQSHSTKIDDMAEHSIGSFIKLKQEVNQLKKELQESREREKNAQRQLIDRICTENAVENDLRSRIEEMKALIKAYEDKLQLEDQVKTKAVQSQVDNSTYSTLANLTVEAEEIIVDIIDNLILDEEVIMDMSNDRIQKLVRDTENYGKGKDKLMEIKTNLRDELGNASKTYSEGLRKKAESAIKNATETKSRLDETIKLLEAEATERRIKFSQSDYEDHMRNFYEPPTFDSLNKSFNIYDFLSRLTSYLEATNIMQDEHGVVLKSCLQDKALTVVEKAYPNMPNPPFKNVKSLLIKHFGDIEVIISDLKTKHKKIGKIPNMGTGDMNVIYKKSSDHSSLIQKTLSVSSQPPRQVVIPKTYLDTIEEILPATYKDKFSTYEIKNTDATPREKLKKLKELVDEIEAKGLLKKTESAKKTSESILHKGSDTDDDNSDSSEENHEYDSEEQESDLEESDQEEEEEEEEEPDQDIPKLSHHYLAYTSVYTGNRVLYD